jgi:hypothetical protein
MKSASSETTPDRRGANMSWSCYEPTLQEILSDPIFAAVMEADAVDLRELDAMLSRIAHGLRATEGGNPSQFAGATWHASARTKQQAPRP